MGAYRPPGVYAQEEVRSIIPSPIPNTDVIAIVSEVPAAAPFTERLVVKDTSTGTPAPLALKRKGVVGTSIRVFSRDEFTEYINGTDFDITSSGTIDYNSTKSITRRHNSVIGETFTLSDATKSYTPLNSRGVYNLVVRTAATTTSPAITYVEFRDYVYDRYSRKIRPLPGGILPTNGTNILIDYNYGIANNEEIVVKYNYADVEYYGHKLFQDAVEVYAHYGFPWNPNGTPNPMSLAVSIAFSNGGPQTQVLAVPVNPHAIDPAKTIATLAEWQLAFDSIAEDEVAIVTETSGLVATQGYLISHVLGASAYNQERIGVIGRDNTKDASGRTELRNYAKAINNQRIVLASPSRWETIDTTNGGTKVVGGQYAAAAIAGGLTLNRVQDTLTRRPINGVRTAAPEAEPLLTGDTASGLFVIENKSGFMRVRHAVTTMFTDVNQRELNVVRAKDFLIKSLREALDRSVIGRLMEPDVDFLVQGAATNVLDRMKNAYIIADYEAPSVFQDFNDPTRLRLRFNYLPNYPVNEISIEFGISSLGTSIINQ